MTNSDSPRVCVLAGGVGAARFLAGLTQVVNARSVTAVVNVADDTTLHGLHISPDLDTVTYTLAGEVNPETGWGLRGESWRTMDELATLGGETWFRLGDRDLATHLYRTHRLSEGASLSEVTGELATARNVDVGVLPVTDDPVRTMVRLIDPGEGGPDGDDSGEVDFQHWFVGLRHAPAVSGVRFDGAETATPAPGVLDAISSADVVVIAPSNPIVSVAPVLAVPGVRDAVTARRETVVAVSPIIAGEALKGPAATLLAQLGHEATVVGVANLYAELAATLVIDTADKGLADGVRLAGMEPVVAPTVMSGPPQAAALARVALAAGGLTP